MKRDMKRQTEKMNTHKSEFKYTCSFTSCLALKNGSYLESGGESLIIIYVKESDS